MLLKAKNVTTFYKILFFFFAFQGTTTAQDARFADKQKKLMKSMKFEKSLEGKVCLLSIHV